MDNRDNFFGMGRMNIHLLVCLNIQTAVSLEKEEVMRKWKLVMIAGVLILSCTGCGEQKKGGINVVESSNDIAEEKDDAAADLESKEDYGETAAFAEQIKAAMADRDMEALADLCSYPLAVEGEAVENRDSFMELDEGMIFSEERCAAIEAVDTSALEAAMAGVVMGENTPNIVFKAVDGTLGITGIN